MQTVALISHRYKHVTFRREGLFCYCEILRRISLTSQQYVLYVALALNNLWVFYRFRLLAHPVFAKRS